MLAISLEINPSDCGEYSIIDIFDKLLDVIVKVIINKINKNINIYGKKRKFDNESYIFFSEIDEMLKIFALPFPPPPLKPSRT